MSSVPEIIWLAHPRTPRRWVSSCGHYERTASRGIAGEVYDAWYHIGRPDFRHVGYARDPEALDRKVLTHAQLITSPITLINAATPRMPMSHDPAIEQEILRKSLTAARVTPEHIETTIVGEQYLHPEGSTLTICILQLRNGTLVIGESACVSSENFDADLGCRIARDKAVDKIWPLEGYLLAQRLHEQANSDPGQA